MLHNHMQMHLYPGNGDINMCESVYIFDCLLELDLYADLYVRQCFSWHRNVHDIFEYVQMCMFEFSYIKLLSQKQIS